MATIVTRITGATAVNRPLTNTELDNNFINLNSAIPTNLNQLTNGPGYITSESDTLATVTGRSNGNYTSTNIGSTSTTALNFVTSGNTGTWIGGIQDLNSGWGLSGATIGFKSDNTTYAAIGIGVTNGLLYFGRTTALGVGTMSSWLEVDSGGVANFKRARPQHNGSNLALVSELPADTLATVTGRGATSSTAITLSANSNRIGNLYIGSGTYKNSITPIDDNNMNLDTPSGVVYVTTSIRSPIFYDKDDSNYYLDPSSQSFINSISVNVGQESTGAANSSSAGLVLRGNYNSNTWAHKFHKYDNGNGVPLYLSTTVGTGAWSPRQAWGNGLTYDSQIFGSFGVDTAVYSPIFYDKDNTAYYIDSNSTSNLNRAKITGQHLHHTYGTSSTWDGTMHYYWNRVATLPDTSYIQLEIMTKTDSNFIPFVYAIASFSTYASTTFSIKLDVLNSYDVTLKICIDNSLNCWVWSSAIWNSNLKWRVIENSGATIYDTITTQEAQPTGVVCLPGQQARGTYGAASSATATTASAHRFSGISLVGIGASDVDFRAPIFYDSGDTGYYLDANSISSLYGVAIRGDSSGQAVNNQLFLWGNTGTTTSAVGFKQVGGIWAEHGKTSAGYNTYFTMDTAGRGWVFRYATVGGTNFTGTNVFSINNTAGETTIGSSWGTSATFAQLNISQGAGSAVTYRDIDIRGSWASGEGHAISATHGSLATNLVGQMVFQYDSPGSRIKWGRLYHGGDVSNYPMELISENSSGQAYLQISSGSMRAPIFYDSNNTDYYLDPASTSIMNSVVAGTFKISSSTPGFFGTIQSSWGGSTVYPTLYSESIDRWVMLINPHISYTQNGVNGFTGSMTGSTIRFASNTSAASYWDIGVNGGAANLGADVYGLSRAGQWNSYWDTSGNGWTRTSHRAPIFYDYNDTNYYCDPNGVTNINHLRINGNWNTYTHPWISAITIRGDYPSMQFRSTNANTMWLYHMDSVGTIHHYYAADGVDSYNWSVKHSMFPTGVFVSTASMRAPIFYDSDNTAYYLDPASSTTSLRTVGDWRSDAAAWSGEFSGKMQYHSNYWYIQAAGGFIFRNSSGTNVMNCDSSGNVTFNANVTAYSDRNKKTNIATLTTAQQYFDKIDAKTFDWKSSGKQDIGFIAQDVEAAGLEMFVQNNEVLDPNTNEVTETVKSLDYGRMVAVLWQTVKELKQELAELKAK
jgi:hypothetical protein